MARKTTKLDLQAELPEVLSRDFNLFYRPEEAPVDKSVEQFTKSLDAFVNQSGIGLMVSAERKEKEMNEAEAIKSFNENRTSFNKAVASGDIPKEANPYFIEKYKELELNKKAEEFKSNLYIQYAENNVLENPDPQAFDKFYNDQLKLFVAENNLGIYDPVKLEKGFFSKTSGTRNQLFQTHVNSQMAKIGEDYKNNFKETIQSKFDKNRTNEEIGADITLFIKDATANGLSKSTAQKYLLESLKEYADTTADLEFAERLLRDLPNYITPGTDALSNVKGLQNDFDEIKQKIDDRILQKEKDDNTKLQLEQSNNKFEASDFADKYDTLSEALQDPEYKTFSRYKQNLVRDEFEKREIDFDSQTNPKVKEDFYKLLEENKIDEALDLINNRRSDLTANDYNNFKSEVNSFKYSGKDGLLASGYYQHWKNEIKDIQKSTNKSKFNLSKIDPLEDKIFEANMTTWLNHNKVEDFKNPTERKTAFEKYVKQEYDKVLEKALSSGTSLSDGEVTTDNEDDTPIQTKKKKIKANKSDLQSSKTEKLNKNTRGGANPENRKDDPELKIDLAKVKIIPENLSRGQRVKFVRDNPNSMTREDYDRILKKQTDMQIAKGAN